MKLALPILVLLAATATAAPPYPAAPPSDGWEWEVPGGIKFVRKADGTNMISFGGIITKQRNRVVEPDGTVTRFSHPSALHSPTSLRELEFGRGFVEIRIPDERALLYVHGDPEPLRGPVQKLKTPMMQAGMACTLHIRAAFRSGDVLLIEDRAITIPAGTLKVVQFDGTGAIRVPLSAAGEQELPPPRVLP